jgi:uncharacterized membrane protein (UPF0182 family)
VVVVVALLSLQGFANFYTDYLWYRSEHLTFVWRGIVEAKLGLASVFVVVMFVATWASLWFVDRMAPRLALFAPELELVRRYQTIVGPHVFAVRTVVSALVAIAVGEGAAGQWQNWILFRHSQTFQYPDPLFGRDASFFVFQLPFLSFVVNWLLIALLVVFVVTVVSHYLNGSIRLQGAGPRVDPIAVAHLSLVLGLAALVKAVGYYYVQRYQLDFSGRGVVQGANYTDVHVSLPALTLLAVVALFSFAVLVYNVYQRSLVLPAIALGLWAVVGLSVGIIYPALVQAFKVTPSQSTLELPYISDNIKATQFAYGLRPTEVNQQPFAASTSVTSTQATGAGSTLNDAVLWDPGPTTTTFQKLQNQRSYFQLSGLSVDRYPLGPNGTLTPVVIGTRTLYSQGVPSSSWVNTHLQYTHGYGIVMAPANTASPSGDPNFAISDLPPQVAAADRNELSLTAPSAAVYFGIQSNNYVVVDSGQSEIDYTDANGSGVSTSKYQGSGGVPIGGFWTRAAFALRFHDFNLLISKLVTPSSQIIFVQGVRQMVQKAAPFLQVDANPYPVLAGGSLYWVVDAYTTTSYFPYSQPADTSGLAGGSGLQGSYDYVRNSVKVVVNAYTGAMSFYIVNPDDPLIEAYSAAFPGLFQPLDSLRNTNEDLLLHLRYPQDFLELQATMYGRYHVSAGQAATFYNSAQAWSVAQSPGTGTPSSPLPTGANGSTARFQPVYEELQLPGQLPGFYAVEPMVPYSQNDRLQTLAGFLVADCDYGSVSSPTYGELSMYTTPQGVSGPALVNSEINGNATISSQISLIDQHGSVVTTGSTLLLPVGNALVYVRPVYVSSSQNQFPQLRYVVAVYGNQVAMATTLSQAVADVFGGTVAGVGVNSNGQPLGPQPQQVKADLAAAQMWARKAAAALASKPPDLGAYEADEAQVAYYVNLANTIINSMSPKGSGGSKGPKPPARSGSTSPSTTTTTVPSTSTTAPGGTA